MSSAKSIRKDVWSSEPLRPRRNPNRIGYQADATGKKRTVGNRGNKNASEIPRRRLYVYWLFEFFSNSYQDLAKEILNNEFALAN